MHYFSIVKTEVRADIFDSIIKFPIEFSFVIHAAKRILADSFVLVFNKILH